MNGLEHDDWTPEKRLQNLYLQADGRLRFDAPSAGKPAFDEYVSDPAKPVPYRPSASD